MGKYFLAFKEARDFVHNLNLKNQREWRKYCKGEILDKGSRPSNIPVNPHHYYKYNGWKNMKNWLGTSYITFNEARRFAHKLKLYGKAEWILYCKGLLKNEKPDNIPKTPWVVYKNDWMGWKDFLGNLFLSYERARAFVVKLKIKSQREWYKYCAGNRPSNIPANPQRKYKNKGWTNWYNFLGIMIKQV